MMMMMMLLMEQIHHVFSDKNAWHLFDLHVYNTNMSSICVNYVLGI